MGKTISRIPKGDGFFLAEDLDYKTVKEDWNVYQLEDGTVFKVKLVASKISRGMESKENKRIIYNDNGEPLYNIRYSVQLSTEVPEGLLKAD